MAVMAPGRRGGRQEQIVHRLEAHKTFRYAIRMAAIVLCFLIVSSFGYLSLRVLAGKHTTADMAFRVLADLRANKPISEIVMAAFGLSGIAYGGVQRSLRRRYIAKWEAKMNAYERSVDPQPSSSHLTRTGTTPDEVQP